MTVVLLCFGIFLGGCSDQPTYKEQWMNGEIPPPKIYYHPLYGSIMGDQIRIAFFPEVTENQASELLKPFSDKILDRMGPLNFHIVRFRTIPSPSELEAIINNLKKEDQFIKTVYARRAGVSQ